VTWQDGFNGTYELLGGVFIALNCVRIYKDKMLRGVDWKTVVFFTTWGWWNLYYYPHLDQWVSFAGGIFIVTANTVWLGQIFYYLRQEKRHGM